MPDLATPLIAWYGGHARNLPWRRVGFGAWGILVSEVMLQQTPVTRVVPHLEAWLLRWPNAAGLAAESPAAAIRQWGNLGYPRRALRLHRAAVEICERHDGVVPRDIDALLALSGVGDYTARAVAAFAYGERHPVVDINTRRVLARTLSGRSQPHPPARGDLELMSSILPNERSASVGVNAAMMELGATVCTARAPRCSSCPLASQCVWRDAGYPNTGDARRRQATFAGSDRQARGALLEVLRDAGHNRPLPLYAALADWPDAEQRVRAIASLVADGLVQERDDTLTLPS